MGEWQKSFKEWSVRVPKRWFYVLSVLATLIPALVAIGYYFVWARNTNPPLPLWNPISLLAGIVLFIFMSFFAFDRVRKERDEQTTKAKELEQYQKECLPRGNAGIFIGKGAKPTIIGSQGYAGKDGDGIHNEGDATIINSQGYSGITRESKPMKPNPDKKGS